MRGWAAGGWHWWTVKGGRAGTQVMRQRKVPVGSVSGRAEDRGTASWPAGMVPHPGSRKDQPRDGG